MSTTIEPLRHVPQEPPRPRPMLNQSTAGGDLSKKRRKKKHKQTKVVKHPKADLSVAGTLARTTIGSSDVGFQRIAAAVQATAVPDPIPAAAESSTIKLKPNSGTTLSIPPSVTAVTVPNPMISGLMVSSIISTTTVWVSPTSQMAASTSMSLESSTSESSRRLPIYVIVLLAFGSTSLAITAFTLIIWLCRGKRRLPFPTPSAPILQDSPLFGGKERLSRSLWADPSFGNLRYSANKSASLLRVGKGDGWKPLISHNGVSDSASEKTLRAPDSVMINEKFMSPSPATMPTPSTPSMAVGVALETPSYAPVIRQPLRPVRKDVPSATTLKAKRTSVITSMYGGAEISSPTLTETMIAYQTPRPAPSPGGKPKTASKTAPAARDQRTHGPLKKSNSGRSVTGNTRRQSMTTKTDKEKDDPFQYSIPSVKSEERRDRDTKALTSALGLASPPLNSTVGPGNNNTTSCFSPISIYPEDSLSMKRRTSIYRHSEMPSPTSMSAALGNFMLQDFPSTATFASFKSNADPFANPAVPIEPLAPVKKRAIHDKPPRVPSPPPLPSLAQMALENADPDYRSPTYSIYGYYETQRKSKASFGTDLM